MDLCKEKHFRRHIPVTVSFSSVVSLFFLQNWITVKDRFYIYMKYNITYISVYIYIYILF